MNSVAATPLSVRLVGSKLRALRGSQSQRELAAKLGVSKSYVSKWERSGGIGVEALVALLILTGCNVQDVTEVLPLKNNS